MPINYAKLFEFAQKHRVPYNEMCAAVREALESAPPVTPAVPVDVQALRDDAIQCKVCGTRECLVSSDLCFVCSYG